MLLANICPICGIRFIEVRPVDVRGETVEFEATIRFHEPDCPDEEAITEELFKMLKQYCHEGISAMECDPDGYYLGEK